MTGSTVIDITMPQLGESVTEGKVSSWLKAPGDTIAKDEPIVEIETDKVTFEVPAPWAGALAEIFVEVGQTAKVGASLATLKSDADVPQSTLPATLDKPTDNPINLAGNTPASRQAHPQPLSPAVRRLVAEHGLDISGVKGSGRSGRVTKADMLALIGSNKATAPYTPGQQSSIAQPAHLKPVAGPRDEVVPLSAVRQRIGEHMVYSAHTAPHGFVGFETDYGNVDAVRLARKDAFRDREGFSLTYLPFVCMAICAALKEFPLINSVVDGDRMIIRGDINLGIAVDLNYRGLMVPVLKNADGLGLTGLAKSISDLARRARNNQLMPEDMSGGTFSITNPGPSGTLISVPIINQPQSAILVTDGVRRRPVVVTLADGSESIAIRPIGNIGLSIDHRAFDGAYAADFLGAVRKTLETRDWDQFI